MQIAKMFASLGFNVDLSGLEKFRSQVKLARTDINNLGRDVSTASKNLTGMSKALDGLNSKLDKTSVAKANATLKQSYENVATSVGKVDKAFQSISSNQKATTKALGRIHSSVKSGEPIWNKYRASVLATRDALRMTNDSIKQLRQNASVTVRTNNGTASNGRNFGGGSNRSGGGHNDLSGGGFFKSMMPSLALAGGLPTLGFALKEVVNQGREQTKMESVLRVTSKDTAEFGDTLKYVREEALRLGLSSVELGKSFAQINMSAGDKLTQDQKKAMFTGMSEFMMTMGTNKDDQKGIFRAMNQMFSNTRILQEEINQLSERGIPATLVWNAAKKAYGTDDIKVIKKMQESGKLDPAKVLPVMAEMMQKMAHESGSFQKMLESSIVKQGQFFEKLSQASQKIMDGGLDKMLGSIFSILTELLAVVGQLAPLFKRLAEDVNYLSDKIKSLNKITDEYIGEGSLLKIVLGGLILFFLRKARAIQVVIRYAKQGTSIFQKMARFFRGGLGSAIKFVARRFLGWVSVLLLVIDVAQRVEKSLTLKHTWMDVWASKLEYLGALMDGWLIKLSFYAKMSGKAFQPWAWGEAGTAMKDMMNVDNKYDALNKSGKSGIPALDAIPQGAMQPSAPLPAYLNKNQPKGIYRDTTEVKIYLKEQQQAIMNIDWRNQSITQAP